MSTIKLSEISRKDFNRFWSKVDEEGEKECWNWKAGCFDSGYGQFWLNGRSVGAHAFSFTIYYGEIGDLFVLHSCDNPGCVSPYHIFSGTPADNTKDMIDKGRANYAYGELAFGCKLNRLKVLEIRRMHSEKEFPLKKLADMFGVSYSQILHIIHRKRWRHI